MSTIMKACYARYVSRDLASRNDHMLHDFLMSGAMPRDIRLWRGPVRYEIHGIYLQVTQEARIV
jgi:hypothetical protein